MYKVTPIKVLMIASALSIVRRAFAQEIPTVEEYCKREGINRSTVHRTVPWLEGKMLEVLAQRRPGPPARNPEGEGQGPPEGEKEILSLHRELAGEGVALREGRIVGRIPRAACEKIVAVVESLKNRTQEAYKKILDRVGMGQRQYRRLRRRVAQPAEAKPRERLPEELLRALELARLLRPRPGISAFSRLFNRVWRETILRTTGKSHLARSTITRYLKELKLYRRRDAEQGAKEPQRFKRLFALAQVVMDTTTIEFLGYFFKTGIVMDCATSQTLSDGVHCRESGKGNAAILLEATERFPGIMSALTDHGTPYRGEVFEGAVRDALMERLLAARHHPEAKCMLERYNRTLKEWLQLFKDELGGTLDAFPEPTRREVALLLARVVVRMVSVTFNNVPQFWADGLSPKERALIPPDTSFEEARLGLAERSEHNLPKGEVVEEILDLLSFRRPGRACQRQELGSIRIDALRKAVARLEHYRERGDSEKDNYAYFLGTANGIADDLRKAEIIRDAQAKRREQDAAEREATKREWEDDRAEDERRPERAVQALLDGVVEVVAKDSPPWLVASMENQLVKALATLASSTRELFRVYVDRFKAFVARAEIPQDKREHVLQILQATAAP